MASVDVAITCYQYARFLEQSSASVLSQEMPGLRLLIIDNASTDGSQEIAKKIAAADSRVSLVLNEKNQGYHDSYNRAVDWAVADFFVLLDADDMLVPGALARGVDCLVRQPGVAFAYGVEGRLINGLLDPTRRDNGTTNWDVASGLSFVQKTCWDSFCDIGAPAVMRRTAAQKKAGYFRKELVRTCDFEMYLRLAMVGDVASTNRVQGIRRIHRDQQSTPYVVWPVRDFEEHEAAFESFFAHEGRDLVGSDDLRKMARKKLGDYAYWHALWQLISRQPGSRDSFRFAAARRPVSNLLPPVSFLLKRRWIRSLRRAARKATSRPPMLSPSK